MLFSIQGTQSRIGGVTFDILAKEAFERHQITYCTKPMDMLVIRNPGVYHWRSGGEKHINDPDSIASLQVNSFNNIFCKVLIIYVYFLLEWIKKK